MAKPKTSGVGEYTSFSKADSAWGVLLGVTKDGEGT